MGRALDGPQAVDHALKALGIHGLPALPELDDRLVRLAVALVRRGCLCAYEAPKGRRQFVNRRPEALELQPVGTPTAEQAPDALTGKAPHEIPDTGPRKIETVRRGADRGPAGFRPRRTVLKCKTVGIQTENGLMTTAPLIHDRPFPAGRYFLNGR